MHEIRGCIARVVVRSLDLSVGGKGDCRGRSRIAGAVIVTLFIQTRFAVEHVPGGMRSEGLLLLSLASCSRDFGENCCTFAV